MPGGLRVVQLGSESLEIAVADVTNAPASLSTADLLGIYKGTYTHWNEIPGNDGGSTDAIVPLIPPSTSVINTTLLADLKAANGGTTVTLASNVAIVEQNDPAAITGLPAPQAKNALTPFSAARLDLYDTGYFHTPGTVFPGGPAAITSGVHLVGGYASPLVHYVVFRQSDTASGALPAWQPGSTKTWVTALFLGSTSFAKSPAGAGARRHRRHHAGLRRPRYGLGRLSATPPDTSKGHSMNRQLRRVRSGATALVLTAGLVATGGGVARASEPLPYTDGRAVGYVGLCDRDGNTVTGGHIHDKPFVWRAVTSVPAPAPYDVPGATATLLGFQPRENVDPGQWSGELLTASARFSNTKYPMAQATDRDFTLADYLGDYPATWDGMVQLRVYLGAPEQPPQSTSYSATDIKVTGDTWQVVRGGAVACTKGDAVSLETLIPASNPAGLAKGSASPSPAASDRPAASAAASAVPSAAPDRGTRRTCSWQRVRRRRPRRPRRRHAPSAGSCSSSRWPDSSPSSGYGVVALPSPSRPHQRRATWRTRLARLIPMTWRNPHHDHPNSPRPDCRRGAFGGRQLAGRHWEPRIRGHASLGTRSQLDRLAQPLQLRRCADHRRQRHRRALRGLRQGICGRSRRRHQGDPVRLPAEERYRCRRLDRRATVGFDQLSQRGSTGGPGQQPSARRVADGVRPHPGQPGGGPPQYRRRLLPGSLRAAAEDLRAESATGGDVPVRRTSSSPAPAGASSRSDSDLPSAPAGLTATGAAITATLTWTPATAVSPITSYTIVATPTTGTPVTTVVPADGLTFPVKVSGLAPSTTYVFSVKATNALGTGPAATTTLKGSLTTAVITPTGVTYGAKITVTGKVTEAGTGKAVAGQTIYQYSKIKGTTTYVYNGAKATTAANGTYTYTYTPNASRTYYTTSRGAGRLGDDSVTSYVTVKGTVTIALNKPSVKAGTTVTFSGTVRPVAGATASLQRKEGTAWVTKKAVLASSTGAYALTWTPASKTDYTWRVVVTGASFSYGASASKVLAVT